MWRLLALCAAATALYVTPPRRLQRIRAGDNDDVTEADVRAWMESADVDELLKDHSFFPKKLAYNLEIWSVEEKENTQSRGEEDII